MEEISVSIKDELNISRLAVIEKAAALFTVLDTDKVTISIYKFIYINSLTIV
jgi:hypothetical protein